MVSLTVQITYHALAIFAIVTATIARPQNGIENQEISPSSSENAPPSPTLSDLQKYYAAYRFGGPGGYVGVEEPNPLDRLQMQILRNPGLYGTTYGGYSANNLNSPGGNNNGGGSAAAYWDPMFRVPEMKRQVRYRQCYFNPISCFKK